MQAITILKNYGEQKVTERNFYRIHLKKDAGLKMKKTLKVIRFTWCDASQVLSASLLANYLKYIFEIFKEKY